MENLQNTEMENEVMPQKVENAQNEQREITKIFVEIMSVVRLLRWLAWRLLNAVLFRACSLN